MDLLPHRKCCQLCFRLRACKDIVERLRIIKFSCRIRLHKSQCSHLIQRYIDAFDRRQPFFQRCSGSDWDCWDRAWGVDFYWARCLLRMEHCLQHGEAVVMSCTDDGLLLDTAHNLAIVSPSPQIPRSSVFGQMIREFEGFLNIANLAFRFGGGAGRVFSSIANLPFRFRGVAGRSFSLFLRGLCEGSSNVWKDMDRDASDKRDFAQILEEKYYLDRSVDQTWLNKVLQRLKGPPPESHFLPPGYQIDSQSVTYIQHIGQGSYGIVDKCEYFGMPVAVKNLIDIPYEVMEAEAALLATVQHPNVVQLIGCARGERTDTGMLVMELMECDLRKLIDRSRSEQENGIPFGDEVAIDIIIQIAEAMLYLKECRVIHRDLRASNVLVKNRVYSQARYKETEKPYDKYDVKLADFGMSKYGEPESSYFATKQRGATLWRAPEVFRDANHASNNYTWSADVYSFGMTCYEIITGCIPFADVKRSELLAKIRAGVRPDFSPACPAYLRDLVERCWALNPDDRPDFNQICEELWICRLSSFFESIGDLSPVVRKQSSSSNTPYYTAQTSSLLS